MSIGFALFAFPDMSFVVFFAEIPAVSEESIRSASRRRAERA